MTAILAFVLSPIGRWVAGASIIVLLLGGIYVKGRQDGKLSYQAKVQREITAAINRGDEGRADALKQLDADGVPDGWFRD